MEQDLLNTNLKRCSFIVHYILLSFLLSSLLGEPRRSSGCHLDRWLRFWLWGGDFYQEPRPRDIVCGQLGDRGLHNRDIFPTCLGGLAATLFAGFGDLGIGAFFEEDQSSARLIDATSGSGW